MRKVELRMNELEKNKTIKKLVEKRLHKNKKPETKFELSVKYILLVMRSYLQSNTSFDRIDII
jgi:hypothetical protein